MKTNNNEIKSLVNDITTAAQNIFSERCVAVYIMGSLARGGFSEIASDIDIGTKTILFPARFIYLERTGKIAGNDVSYQYYMDNFSGNDAELVQHGYQWRLNSLPEDVSLVTEQLNKGLMELYHNFIDTYVNRMGHYGEDELKNRLIDWKKHITSVSF